MDGFEVIDGKYVWWLGPENPREGIFQVGGFGLNIESITLKYK